jgi:1-acyl-sn-glycerol-3-phosphate acyltransferase
VRRGAAIVFSCLFYPLLAAYTLLAVPLLALGVAAGAPFATHRENMRRFRRMISWYGNGIIRGLARPLVRIRYESPARTPGIARIFVANHVAASDPFLMAVLPEEVVQVVNLWPFKLPVWGRFARWAGYLNIRAMAPDAFQARAARLLAEGVSIVAFPEGTRAGTKPMGPFHGALFRLALATRAPLVPMCIAGNARTPARDSLLLEPATIRIRCLPELPWEQFGSRSPFQLKNHVRLLIQDELTRMGVRA